jgi:Rieske Fe-S protein
MSDKNGNCGCDSDVESPSKRKLLGWIVGLINLSLFAAIFGPVAGFVGSPLRRKRKGVWVELCSADSVADGAILEVPFSLQVKDGYRVAEHKYTVFLRRSGDEFTAFDPACTHLGCRIKYQDQHRRFLCPCHGGVFAEDGKVVSGPPPRPLETHTVKVESGKVLLYNEV